MFPYARLNEILEYFINHNECISPFKLAKQFQISQRTLRNDIHMINDELTTYHVQILMKRKEGYFLQFDDEASLSLIKEAVKEKDEQLDSADKRINHLIIHMLYANDYVTQDALADEVFVSTNTIINYLKTIRLILSNYDLHLQTKANLGYIIIGNELDKRRCIIDLITSNYHHYAFQFSKEQKVLLDNVNLELIKDIVMKFNRKHHVHFSDYNLKNLILHIALSISRLQVSKTICNYEVPADEDLKALLDPLIALIENDFQITFSEEERNYIYSHYVSNTNELLNADRNVEYIHNLVEHMVTSIYASYHFDLRCDLILEKDLLHHLQSILNAKYYHLNKKNPLLNTIKSNYILAYEITETAVKEAFQNEPFTLTDDEIGYISLHIGAAIERYFNSRYVKRKKVIILYDSGFAAGSFIASKLTTMFKDTLEIVGKYPSHEFEDIELQHVDLLISTVALPPLDDVPVVVVDIPLLRKDVENIAKVITMDDIHPIDKITKFFDEDLFMTIQAEDKETVIHTLCERLKDKECVHPDFEASVLARENRVSTAMDGVVAIPHPLQICAVKSKIAVGILQKPVKWSHKDNAQIVLMLALADDAKKDIEKLYDTFVIMMHNPPLQSLLFQARSLDEFLTILKENISEEDY